MTDVAAVAVTGFALFGGDFVTNMKNGNYTGAANNLQSNIQKNLPQILTGIGIGVGGKMLRKTRLAPRVGMKGFSVGV